MPHHRRHGRHTGGTYIGKRVVHVVDDVINKADPGQERTHGRAIVWPPRFIGDKLLKRYAPRHGRRPLKMWKVEAGGREGTWGAR